MQDLKDVTTTTFGLGIAYFLPGLVGLLGASFWSTSLASMFSTFLKTQSNVGLFLLVVSVSLTVGLELGIVRWLIFERTICKSVYLTPEEYALLQTDTKLAVLRLATDEMYRYSQFFGGMVVAMPLLYVGWLKHAWPTIERRVAIPVTLGFIGLEVLTAKATIISYERFIFRSKLILRGGANMPNGLPGPDPAPAPDPGAPQSQTMRHEKHESAIDKVTEHREEVQRGHLPHQSVTHQPGASKK